MSEEKNTYFETMKVKAEDLVKTVKKLVKEGNVRKITLKNKEGEEVASFPLTAGVVGIVLAPVLAALGAVAAVMTECSISIEREKKE